MKNRVYLDNCCFNRPFDDPHTLFVRLEAEAKTYIQDQIRSKKIELAWSYILDYECAANPYEERKNAITTWKGMAVVNIDADEDVLDQAVGIGAVGIHAADALHIACALKARCRYFLTTDRRILKKRIEGITLLNPVDYVRREDET